MRDGEGAGAGEPVLLHSQLALIVEGADLQDAALRDRARESEPIATTAASTHAPTPTRGRTGIARRTTAVRIATTAPGGLDLGAGAGVAGEEAGP